MIQFETPFCEVSYDEGINTVIVVWRGYAKSEQFHETLGKVLDFMASKKCHNLLMDNTNIWTITKEDEAWIATDFQQLAVKAGLKKSAVVMPGKLVQKNVVNRLNDVAVATHIVDMAMFPSLEEAKEWFRH